MHGTTCPPTSARTSTIQKSAFEFTRHARRPCGEPSLQKARADRAQGPQISSHLKEASSTDTSTSLGMKRTEFRPPRTALKIHRIICMSAASLHVRAPTAETYGRSSRREAPKTGKIERARNAYTMHSNYSCLSPTTENNRVQ